MFENYSVFEFLFPFFVNLIPLKNALFLRGKMTVVFAFLTVHKIILFSFFKGRPIINVNTF